MGAPSAVRAFCFVKKGGGGEDAATEEIWVVGKVSRQESDGSCG